MECIFCQIAAGKVPTEIIYQDEEIIAFRDIEPQAPVHLLIIPKKHTQDLWEIPGEDLAAVHVASQKIIQAIKDALNPVGVACVQLNGRGVNQVVMHYHLHLVPRSGAEPELPLTRWELRPGDMDRIKETAERIAAAIR